MQAKSLDVLEYNKILEKLSKMARSGLVKKQILELRPSTDVEYLEDELEKTGAMAKVIARNGNIDIFGLFDFTNIVGYIRRNGILDPVDLLKILSLLRVSEYLKEYSRNIDDPYILDLFDRISTNEFLKEEIDRSILNEEEIADNASRELLSIRRSLRRKEEEIKNKLNSYVTSPKYESALQDKVVSVRDGRYVVPIKTNKRSVINGIVHDKSASGNTLFIEPSAIVELNNQYKDLELKEDAEIRRILDRLSRFAEKDYKYKRGCSSTFAWQSCAN